MGRCLDASWNLGNLGQELGERCFAGVERIDEALTVSALVHMGTVTLAICFVLEVPSCCLVRQVIAPVARFVDELRHFVQKIVQIVSNRSRWSLVHWCSAVLQVAAPVSVALTDLRAESLRIFGHFPQASLDPMDPRGRRTVGDTQNLSNLAQ